MLGDFPDGTFRLDLYDGDHSYEGASRDAAAASSKVKPGGYLVFNDFAHADPYLGAYGVHRAGDGIRRDPPLDIRLVRLRAARAL